MQEQSTPAQEALPEAGTEQIPENTAPVDAIPSMEEMLRQAELKAAEHHDAWLRAKADADNTRRRAQEDIAKASRFAIEKFAENLLAVKDTLEMALLDNNVETMRAGVDMTLKNLIGAFEKSGLSEVNPVGEKFDPNRHQAISAVESDQEANTVVTVLQKGYLISERVLRPAMVMVAKTKEAPNN